MRTLKIMASSFVLLLGLANAASAADNSGKPGEIWVDLKGADYTKPFEGEEEFSEHEFEANGFKLIIRIPDVGVERTFELRPSDDSLGPVTITTEPKKFKVARVKGDKLARLVYRASAKFVAKPKQAPPAEAPPADAPPTDAPPAEPAPAPGG